jgi:hypothetical protein
MALPASGQLSLSQIVGEFGGSAPHSLSEYYRNGGLVPSGNTNVPTSGTIDFSDFYGAQAIVNRDIRVQMSYYAGHSYTAFGVTSANSTAAPQSYSGSLLFNPFTIYSPVFRAGTGYLGQNLSFTYAQNEDAQASSVYLYGGTSSTAVNTLILGLVGGYNNSSGGSRSFTVAFDSNGGCTGITNTANSGYSGLISWTTNNPSTSHRWYMWRMTSPNATEKGSTMMSGDPANLSSVPQPA